MRATGLLGVGAAPAFSTGLDRADHARAAAALPAGMVGLRVVAEPTRGPRPRPDLAHPHRHGPPTRLRPEVRRPLPAHPSRYSATTRRLTCGNEQGAGSALPCGGSCLVCSCRLHARRERCCGRSFRIRGSRVENRPGSRVRRARRPYTSPESGRLSLLSKQQLAIGRPTCWRRDVARGGEVAAALTETSARRRCHNVAGAGTSGESEASVEQGGCT
jgi:hypothetical protein